MTHVAGGPNWARLRYLWYADLYRYDGQVNASTFVRHMLITPGYKYTFVLRLCDAIRYAKPVAIWKPLFALLRFLLWRMEMSYGICIYPGTNIQEGLYIGHYGGVFVNPGTVIGKNCNLSMDVIMGWANRGPRRGVPTLGDNVYVGPGARIIGAVRIGNNVAIGANCVVTRDIPDNSVAVGIPATIVSEAGVDGYISNTDY
ncbi:MAG: serine acetyltransferase [Chloroflexota bacterium]